MYCIGQVFRTNLEVNKNSSKVGSPFILIGKHSHIYWNTRLHAQLSRQKWYISKLSHFLLLLVSRKLIPMIAIALPANIKIFFITITNFQFKLSDQNIIMLKKQQKKNDYFCYTLSKRIQGIISF